MTVGRASLLEGETKGERTRRLIMTEARCMIDEVGIEAISQEAVARRVGITQSALRHHFPTRESMFDAIFDHAFTNSSRLRTSYWRLLALWPMTARQLDLSPAQTSV